MEGFYINNIITYDVYFINIDRTIKSLYPYNICMLIVEIGSRHMHLFIQSKRQERQDMSLAFEKRDLHE